MYRGKRRAVYKKKKFIATITVFRQSGFLPRVISLVRKKATPFRDMGLERVGSGRDEAIRKTVVNRVADKILLTARKTLFAERRTRESTREEAEACRERCSSFHQSRPFKAGQGYLRRFGCYPMVLGRPINRSLLAPLAPRTVSNLAAIDLAATGSQDPGRLKLASRYIGRQISLFRYGTIDDSDCRPSISGRIKFSKLLLGFSTDDP